ncbi:dTMP kinase [Ktedonobacter racemifer]|uniref:Thymidylate kinase n=1 Tax=Ktedonobacter racemifer DSM 44963 TaxID=485913 RepID=D6TPL0_KTERA|nr:dTMP kinase [Ktedonobacter racemifer]EFH85624.1 thymidylate kinase [Ktedonobacter racemifer DSM 44963]
MERGVLISFEGLDGAGKTTQMNLLEAWLQSQGVSYLRTREPGGSPLGVEIRRLLLNRPDLHISPLAEALLFQADRAQHFAEVILPALDEGKVIVSDRCFDSSIAYQGAARGVGEQLVEDLSLLATQGHQPDLTIMLDLPPEKVQQRTNLAVDQGGTRTEQSHFDRETETFHRTLREAFLTLARRHPQRIKVLDASRTPEVIQREIQGHVERLLAMHS